MRLETSIPWKSSDFEPPWASGYGYGSIPINTIFRGMNIHLPAILMFTRGTDFDTLPYHRHQPRTRARRLHYNGVLQEYSKTKLWDLAISLLQSLPSQKVRPDKAQLVVGTGFQHVSKRSGILFQNTQVLLLLTVRVLSYSDVLGLVVSL